MREANDTLNKVLRRIHPGPYRWDTYRRLYGLPVLCYERNVPPSFLASKAGAPSFVICVIHAQGKLLALPKWGPELGWELPAGPFDWAEEPLHQAVTRIARPILPGTRLTGLTPLALLEGRFSCGRRACSHRGLVVLARARDCGVEALGAFLEPGEIREQASPLVHQILDVAEEHLGELPLIPCDEEEKSVDRRKWVLRLHQRVIKPALRPFSSRLIDQKILELFKATESRTFLDVSCGDNGIIFKIASSADLAVGNDVCLPQVEVLSRSNRFPHVIFTNHDARALPFKMKFDFVLCKHTLHHLPTQEDLAAVLHSLKQVARTILLVDWEDPMVGSLSARLFHRYYRVLLGDCGRWFFLEEEFQRFLEESFKGKAVTFSTMQTLKGKVLFALIRLE